MSPTPSGRSRLGAPLAVVLGAGPLPWLLTVAAEIAVGDTLYLNEPLHEGLELLGSCVALGVALLLMQSAREGVPSHLLWFVTALIAMATIDAVHGLAPVGVSWSWLRHVATLVGGLLFGLVWLPLPASFRRQPHLVVAVATFLALAGSLAVWWNPGWLPAPWLGAEYTLPVKAANFLGGLGFLAAALFFLRRYLADGKPGHLLFACHTLLFGAASLLFGFSVRWRIDWWLWHGFRLAAYTVVIVAAYRMVLNLHREVSTHAADLRQAINALQAENAERRAAEEALKRQQDHLEDLVEERTEALREADRRKDDFIAVLSHELRNPLAPIKSALYILAHSEPDSAPSRRAQDILARQVDQLSRLVDDLLDVTRVRRNKIALKRETVDLCELLRRAVEDLRPLFERRHVGLDLELPRGEVLVDGDAARLAQVVGNLLQNAAKFTDRQGRVTVTLTADGESARAIVSVRDTGLGMSSETLGHLFHPFVQADATLDRSRGGLGLGLALVKGITELHGGRVAARSAGLGRGSEFIVELPLLVGATSGPSHHPPVAPIGRKRILVVEDNVDSADSLRDALILRGHDVAVEHAGLPGVARARRDRPDVVICDIGLPGMNGYQVARAISTDPALRSVLLVALSGYARPEDLERSAAAGFALHLAKPLDPVRLEIALQSISAPTPPARVSADAEPVAPVAEAVLREPVSPLPRRQQDR